MNNKLCYVFLPVYNGKRYVKETLERVLEQDYTNYKVIITDDCSTDDTYMLLKEYRKKYPEKIILMRNAQNLGVGNTLHNMSLEYSDASFIAQVGQDDIWPTNYLTSQIDQLEKTGAVVSFSRTSYIDDIGKEFKPEQEIFHPHRLESNDREGIFLSILKKNFLCAPASVVNLELLRKECFAEFWGYNNDRLQDCELWLNLSLLGRFTYNKKVVMKYRLHNTNMSDESKRIMQGRLEYYTMIHRILFSPLFDSFFDTVVVNKIQFIEKVFDTLACNIPYSPFLKILIIEMAEKYLNMGFESDCIKNYLYSLYQDCGLTTKCLKGGRVLSGKIEIIAVGTIKHQNIMGYLEANPNFCVKNNVHEGSVKSMLIVDDSGMEYLLNDERFYFYYEHGQVIVISDEDSVETAKKRYANVLVIDADITERELSKAIFEYIEDRTSIYRNGFLDLDLYKNLHSEIYQKVLIENKDEQVRFLEILDTMDVDLDVITCEGTKLEKYGKKGNQVIYKRNNLNDVFYIVSSKGIGVDERIVVNNKLYRCMDIIMCEGELIPRFQMVAYHNYNHHDFYVSYREMLSYIDELKGEIGRIKRSRRYKLGDRVANIAMKLGIIH